MHKFENYIFDLDATLYQDNGEVEADCERLVEDFFCNRMKFSKAEAQKQREIILQRYRYEAQAMENMYGISEKEFMDYICDTTVAHIKRNPVLDSLLRAIPGRLFVFTDSTCRHVQSVLEQIGVDVNIFDDVCDAEKNGFYFKFQKDAFENFIRKYAIDPQRSIIFEDSLRNLQMAKSFEMTTVLISPNIHHESFLDHQFTNINKALEYFLK